MAVNPWAFWLNPFSGMKKENPAWQPQALWEELALPMFP